jgi:hypothetical protein
MAQLVGAATVTSLSVEGVSLVTVIMVLARHLLFLTCKTMRHFACCRVTPPPVEPAPAPASSAVCFLQRTKMHSAAASAAQRPMAVSGRWASDTLRRSSGIAATQTTAIQTIDIMACKQNRLRWHCRCRSFAACPFSHGNVTLWPGSANCCLTWKARLAL